MWRAIFLVSIVACAMQSWAQPAAPVPPPRSIVVGWDNPGAAIQETMVGIFFEDINFGADGGLYAELVKNRSFEFPEPLMGWRADPEGGTATVDADPDRPEANRNHLLLAAVQPGFGVQNEGFRGIGVKQGEVYRLAVMARAEISRTSSLHVELIGQGGAILAEGTVPVSSTQWRKRMIELRAEATDPRAALRISLERRDAVELDWVSLLPQRALEGQPAGLRPDLVAMLADLKPGFLRFPGGCIVEGRELATRYQWKKTLGDPADRPLLINRWNTEFEHRPTPDYFQSFGLGFLEYFLLSEALGAQPLPILNCGMACQFNTGELAPLEDLDPYIQDALDLIEFANGEPTTPWGKRRADLGHPAPFGLRYLGIGNEQWGPEYVARYERIASAITLRHPDIQLIGAAGPSPSDERNAYLWEQMRRLGADIVDEHCYANPSWFLDAAYRYDDFDRAGPRVFMGEYAAQSDRTVSPANRSNWACALAEAAFLTGLERNADLVVMSAYAPLLGHEDAWQWRPDLIWFDNLRSYGTPSYHVQKLFGTNRADRVLPVRIEGQEPATSGRPGLYASAGRKEPGTLVLKVVNSAPEGIEAVIALDGGAVRGANGSESLIQGELEAENSFAEPRRIAPVEHVIERVDLPWKRRFEPNSVTVLRLSIEAE